MITKNTNSPWSFYIAVFLLIYCSKDSCFFGVNSLPSIKLVGYAISFIVVVFLVSKAKINKIVGIGGKTIAWLSFLSIVSMLLSLDVPVKYLYEIMLFFSCGAIVYLIPFDNFKTLYTDILYYLALISIVLYVINLISPDVLNVFPLHHNEGGYPFRYCILGVTTRPEYELIRNWGIFREPGVYIFYLNLGLIFELFGSCINYKKVICFIVTIITTLSTAGFIVAAGIMITSMLFSKHASKNRRNIITVVIVGVIIVLSSDLFDSIYGMVFGKLFYENDSTASRTGSFITNINMWLNNVVSILFGQGYTFVENEFLKYQSAELGGENNTNTPLKMLAVHGIIYTLIIYGLTYRSCIKHFGVIGLYVLVFILMLQSNEDLIVSFHTYLLAFYALEKKL